MSEKIILKARGVRGPKAEGVAMVFPDSIIGWNALNVKTGVVTEDGNVHKGESIKGKIVVLPSSKGSLGWSAFQHLCALNGVGPAGYIFTKMDSKCGTTIALTKAACVADFDKACDPCKIISDGDHVILDGDAGTVEIIKK